MQLWNFSSILHGEQGALNLSASLCHVLKDQGAQEYAANQTREEARHVTAFAKYIKSRWGRPVPCGAALKALLIEIIESPAVYKKIIGMQMLVEGLAMGAFANGFRYNRDPLARKLFQLVMTDEAFHHKFGKIWADKTIPQAHRVRAQHGRGLGGALRPVAALQQRLAAAAAGDLRPSSASIRSGCSPTSWSARKNKDPKKRFKGETNVFRVLIKTLLNAGLITDAHARLLRACTSTWTSCQAEGTRMVGDDIAEEGIRYLQAINFKDQGRTVSIAAE